MRTRTTYKIGLAVAASAVLAGCGQQPGGEPSPAPSPSPSVVEEEPPREPGDASAATGWVSGMVTVGGSGPCYGFVADDGKRYALYSTGGLELEQGSRMRVLLEPTMVRIYCGPGSLMAMTDAEQVK